MTDAREIIAAKLPTSMKYAWAQELIDALHTAGFRILGPDEVDQVTAERCAEVADSLAHMDNPGEYNQGVLDASEAIRTIGRKA